MKRAKKGFTILEVTLFLAITGLLLVGLLATTWNSISRQRTNDIVQNFADFLGSQYSAVANVQSNGAGNSGKAIYGKVVTFGEEGAGDTIYIYDLFGDVVPSDTIARLSVPKMLEYVHADVIVQDKIEGTNKCNYSVHNQSEYSARYGTKVQTADGDDFKGTIIISRSPSSGSIHTYVASEPIEVQKILAEQAEVVGATGCQTEPFIGIYDNLQSSEINFCLNSEYMLGRIYDVKIERDAKNATNVKIVNLDDPENNKCEN